MARIVKVRFPDGDVREYELPIPGDAEIVSMEIHSAPLAGVPSVAEVLREVVDCEGWQLAEFDTRDGELSADGKATLEITWADPPLPEPPSERERLVEEMRNRFEAALVVQDAIHDIHPLTMREALSAALTVAEAAIRADQKERDAAAVEALPTAMVHRWQAAAAIRAREGGR